MESVDRPDGAAARVSIPLDGRLERSSLPPLLTAILALLVAFLLFQVVVSPLVLLLVLGAQGISPMELLNNMEQILENESRALLIANTAGQVLAIGLPALLLARGHSSAPLAFLRMRRIDGTAFILALVGLAALIPITQWVGTLNEMLPLPEWVRAMEAAQHRLLERTLMDEANLVFNLLVLAVTPAVCEELLFRGYVQRQAERSLGFAGGIVFSGVVFGLYHLRLTQIVPLTLVGLYLAYLTWHFRSIWPAVVAHFVFNGFAVVLGAVVSREGGLNVEDIDKMDVPWYLLVGCVVILGIVVRIMRRRTPAGAVVHEVDPYERRATE